MFKNRPNISIKVDGKEFWISRSVAVIGVVVLLCKEKLFVLITRRAETMTDEPNRWCLPCGYLDWDENIYGATIREIYEETGLNLHLPYRMHAYPELYIDSSPVSNRQNISIANGFLIETDEFPELTVTEETNDVAWCDAAHLKDKNLAFNHWSLTELAIDKVMQQLTKD